MKQRERVRLREEASVRGAASGSRSAGRLVRGASLSMIIAITSLGFGALTARAADVPQKLPAVTVTGEKSATASPGEVAYADAMFKKLDKASRYPTGREASLDRPSGTAKVWVELQRSGKVVGHGVEQSSGSPLLDQMAVNLVTRAKYASLPQDVWTGETRHRFVASYKFDGAAMTAGAPAKGKAAGK